MSSYNKLINNLETLKLEKFRSYLPNYIEEIAKKQIPFTDALLELTEKELDFRNESLQRYK